MYASQHGLRLENVNDALDALGVGLPGCIFVEADLHPDFFDLSNGLAGEILQKFSTYNFHAAFVIQDMGSYSPRIRELALDHRNHPCIRLFEDKAQAEAWIGSLQSQQQQ